MVKLAVAREGADERGDSGERVAGGIWGGACHGWRMGQILQLRADAHVMSECSDQEEVPPVVTLGPEPTRVYP
jgi:hypothetical protein